jgi:TldD protein
MKTTATFGLLTLLWLGPALTRAEPPASADLLALLNGELQYAMDKLALPDGTKPYFLGYTITDRTAVRIGASLGALEDNDVSRRRSLDVDLRVGDYAVDNTHKLRGGGTGLDPSDLLPAVTSDLSLDDDPDALRHALWLATDSAFKSAAKKYQRVLTDLKTKVAEEDKSGDFTREKPATYSEPLVKLDLDRTAWAATLRDVARLARDFPLIYTSNVSLSATVENRWLATSEGTRLQTGRKLLRIAVSAASKADDGMELSQTFIFNASSEDKLPAADQIKTALQGVIDQVLALRTAPVVEPYIGPAILRNRASGVFFHEIFGHRIEGHRQKDVEEGQTFAKMVGEAILPDFITVRDDPTRARFGDEDLRGFYRYDDEGVAPTNVLLVENGILRTFLMSRSPLTDFPQSNGHGRREPGRTVCSRQGNLLIESTKAVSYARLKEMLVEECRRQDKPYGLLFDDITGGFTRTGRGGGQGFKVLPVVVYRVYADGRPDELIRGVDIVGTPLTCFSKIIETGDDAAVFNGTCGAESGNVPVSAISPSILVSQIEVEKRRREQDKPPILPPPIATETPAGQGK